MSTEVKGRDKIINIGRDIIPDFEIKDIDIENYQKLYLYFTRNEAKCNEYGIDIKKGLWIFGDVGCGKTIAMKVFQDFCGYNQHLGSRRFSMYWFQKVKKDYEDKERRKYFTESYGYDAKKDICFDEFLKRANIKDFGIIENIAEMIIDERYERFMNDGFITHITTNYPPTYVAENKLLDVRTLDRCTQMFNIIEWKGGSKR